MKEALLQLSEDGATLPISDATFVPALIGIIRGIAVLTAARNASGSRIDPFWLGRELGREFAQYVLSLEREFAEMQAASVDLN